MSTNFSVQRIAILSNSTKKSCVIIYNNDFLMYSTVLTEITHTSIIRAVPFENPGGGEQGFHAPY